MKAYAEKLIVISAPD